MYIISCKLVVEGGWLQECDVSSGLVHHVTPRIMLDVTSARRCQLLDFFVYSLYLRVKGFNEIL